MLPRRPLLAVVTASLLAGTVPAAAQLGTPPSAATDAASPIAPEAAWYPISIESREPPFYQGAAYTRLDYIPLADAEAAERWEICASVPPTTFEYFRAMRQGLEAEAARQGVAITVTTVDDFDVETQVAQLDACLEAEADALIVGAVGPEGYGAVLARARAAGVPVINAVTGFRHDNVTARIVTDRIDVGRAAGRFLADRHPAGAELMEVVWLHGPPNSDVSTDVDLGFRAGIESGEIAIVHAASIRLDDASIRDEIRSVLAADTSFGALVGGGRTVRLAAEELAAAFPAGAIELVSVTVTAPVVAGIEAGRVFAAVNDKALAQARIGVDLAVRAIEGRPHLQDMRPTLGIVDRSNVDVFDRGAILPAVE